MVHADVSAPRLPEPGAGAGEERARGAGRLTGPDAARTACAHCGLPLARARGAADRAEAFCCTGCRVAWSVAGHGKGGTTDRLLARLVLSAFLATGVMVASLALYGEAFGDGGSTGGDAAHAMRGLYRLAAFALTAPVVGLLGFPLAEAVVRMRRWLSAEALIVCGVGAAFLVSTWGALTNRGEVYFETTAMVLVLVTLGRWIEARAKERARERLAGILPEREEPALLFTTEGSEGLSEVDPEGLARGDVVLVRPGARVPADGVVRAGRAFLDASALTGEAEPRSVGPGDAVLAGSTPTDGALEVEVRAAGTERLVARVERLLEQALLSRAPAARLADRVAAWLLPLVLLLALGTVLYQLPRLGVEHALFAGLSVVLISCPCALGIATPLAFWVALGEAWRRGVLVRGAETLETLAHARRVLFDKTGTLTTGALELAEVRVEPDGDAGEALRLAAALEWGSEHPVGRAVVRAAAGTGAAPARSGDLRVLPGRGVEGTVEGRTLRLVRAGPEEADGGRHGDGADALTRVRLEEVGPEGARLLALLSLTGALRPEAARVVERLGADGLEVGVLTGDAAGPARALGAELGVPVAHGLSPEDKLLRVRAAGAGTVFVGDGLNDTAALAAADVGVCVAGGVDRSLEAAPVDLLRPGLDGLPELLALARRTLSVARGNLFWAFAYNALGLGFAASGKLSPIFAASAMVVSSAAVVLHSARLRTPARELAPPGRPEAGTSRRTAPGSEAVRGQANSV